jgi:hypothetical protein
MVGDPPVLSLYRKLAVFALFAMPTLLIGVLQLESAEAKNWPPPEVLLSPTVSAASGFVPVPAAFCVCTVSGVEQTFALMFTAEVVNASFVNPL